MAPRTSSTTSFAQSKYCCRRSRAFIEDELTRLDPARTVVVTHHAPSRRSTQQKGEDWDHLYGSNLDALIEDCGPALWIHGHVHDSFDYQIGSTRVLCNPRGYLRYGENADFDPGRTAVLPCVKTSWRS